MSTDCLKLTAYLGERARTGDRLVTDALLDLYGRHEIASSILLRGIAGFGRRNQLRTDSSLTLSEDLPVVAVAIDDRARIEALLDEATQVASGGLITLERARLHAGALDPMTLTPELLEATKLTVYLGRQERVGRQPAFAAVCDLLYRRGVAGATTLLGVDGTVHGRRERGHFFRRNADVPMMVLAVGSGERIAGVLPELAALLRQPLLSLERVRICKRDGALIQTPHELPGTDEHRLPLWQKLTVYTSEAQLHAGAPVHRALVRRMRESGASGATTLRGIWGFHGAHAPHGDRVLQYGRHVPTVTTVIDSPSRIAELFSVVDELTAEHGLVTSEMVPALRSQPRDDGKGGWRLAQHRF